MTCPAPSPERMAALRTLLATEQARAQQLEARTQQLEETVHLQAQAVAELTAHLASRAGVAKPVTRRPSRSSSVTDEREALRPQGDGASVTPERDGVTEEKKARARTKSAARQRAYRLRQAIKRSVTAERDGVTASVTKEEGEEVVVTPLPPSSFTQESVTPVTRDAAPSSGRLRLQGQLAARDTRRRARAQAEHSAVPVEVLTLRSHWQELVVGSGKGFAPWPERMSERMVEDALSALARRPLSEWREVFALVPRSPLCRGQLTRKQPVDVLWLLVGQTGQGREPAEMLLTHAWSIDPEEPPPASNEVAKPEALGEASPGDSSPPTEAWRQVRALLAEQGKRYALDQLEPLRPHALVEGWLVVIAPDRFRRVWVGEHYGELLRQLAERCGLAGVRVDVEGGS